MHIVWFCIVSVMIAAYFVLDGFDLGAGVVHLLVARNERERRSVLAAVGPFWDGNEVWLLAGGGVLYFAFPAVYASGFSGFYLALMIVLWLLILRGMGIELRNHVDSPMWRKLWDRAFAISSLLLAVFYGAALGNIVRGVPLDENGYFFLPLWTNFLPGPDPGLLDWFTVLCGVAALAVLTLHGALWVAFKTEGDLRDRCRIFASRFFWVVAAVCGAVTISSFAVQPHILTNVQAHPGVLVFAVIALMGMVAVPLCLREAYELGAFAGSSAMIIGLLCCAAAGQFPSLLVSSTNDARSLTVDNSAAPAYGLSIGLAWWIPAMVLAVAYTVFVHWQFRARVKVSE